MYIYIYIYICIYLYTQNLGVRQPHVVFVWRGGSPLWCPDGGDGSPMRCLDGKAAAPGGVWMGVAGESVCACVCVFQGLYPSKDWCKTTFESKLVRSDTQRSIASSGYFTKHQYFEKLGSWELVDELVKRKEESGAFVPHPDLPDIAAARLYLGFDSAAYQHIGDTANSNTLTSRADIGNPGTAHDIAMNMMKAKALPVQLNLQDPSALKALHTTAPKFKTPGSNGKAKPVYAGKAATGAKPKASAMQHITSALKW